MVNLCSKFKSALISMSLVIMLVVPSSAMAYGTVDIIIDGISVKFNEASGYPFVSYGRTMVPLRVTMESFGAKVNWESETKTALVKKDSILVKCTIGEKMIRKNNKEVPNDAAAVIVDSRTYLPIRAVLEAFGAKVDWNGAVNVKSGSRTAFIQGIEGGTASETSYSVAWNMALNYKEDGKYREAIEKITSVSPIIVTKGDNESSAEMFKTLGECYLALEENESAAECFAREAYYWSLMPECEENRLSAQERFYKLKN